MKIAKCKIQVFLPLFFSLLILSACSKGVSEENRLKAIVNEVAEAAQKKDIDTIRRHLSKSYKDQDGNDYDSVRKILTYHFIRAETISIFVRSTDVEINPHTKDFGVGVKGDTALVQVNVVFVRGKEVKTIKNIIPESAAGYRFDVIFKKEKGDWKVMSAEWQDVGAAGLL